MRFDVDEMRAAFGDANDFDSVTRDMGYVGLDPWYTYGDERYFEVLNGSSTANFQWDMSLLYDRYYARAETLPIITEFEVVEVEEPEPCEDGTPPPCTVNDPNDEPDDNTDQTNDDDDGNGIVDPGNNNGNGETTTPVDTSQAEDDDVEQQALLLFFAIVVVLLAALYVVSRGGEDALAAEVQIEKMWDKQEAASEAMEASSGFVPALPPLERPSEENE